VIAMPKSYRKPVLFTLDMKAGDVPWAEFATDKEPRSQRERHLVAAAWLSAHAHFRTITPVHLFACYNSVGWSFDTADPAATLRVLTQEGLGTLEGGTFRINRRGLSLVEKMSHHAGPNPTAL
jgi:uncharacterized protein YjhX (UPF0386 family)